MCDFSLYMQDEEISNHILIVLKILLQNYSDSFVEVFSLNLLSNSIMYKTWNSSKNTNIVIEILNGLFDTWNKIHISQDADDSIAKEFAIIEGLCDHECIRDEIRNKLKNIFGKVN
jgi:hypothetical protein